MTDSGSTKAPSIRVHTRGIRDVLSPISDQVAELIIVDERARQNKSGIPDLTKAAESIGAAIQSLVLVGESALEKGDDILKSRMPAACQQIEAAGKLFLDASVELKADPFSEEARALLITATRGLLTGTTNILMTYDTFEVRKIVVLGEGMIELLSTAKDISTLEELVVLVKSLSTTLVSFVQLVEARQAELVSDTSRQTLIRENEALRKASPLLVTALRTFIFNSDNDQARVSRDYAIEQALGSIHRIVVCVSDFGPMDDISTTDDDSYVKAKEAMEFNIFNSGVGPKSRDDLDTLVATSRTIGSVGSHGQAVEDAAVKFSQCFEAFALQPTNQAASDSALSALYALDQAVKTSVTHQVTSSIVSGEASNVFVAEVQSGNLNQEGEDAFEAESKALVDAALNAASLSNDARRSNLVRTTAKQVEEYSQQIATTAHIVSSQSSDDSAMQHLVLLKDNYDHQTSLLKTLSTSLVDAGRMAAVTGEHIQHSITAAQDFVADGNTSAVNNATNNIANNVNLLTTIAITEAENSDDPSYSQPILEAANNLKDAVPRVASAFRAQANSPQDSLAEQAAEEAAKDLKVNIVQLQNAIVGGGTESDDELSRANSNPDLTEVVANFEQLQVKKEEVEDTSTATTTNTTTTSTTTTNAQSLLEGSNQPQGPIADAARSLKKEADKWSTQNNPIVASASEMAEDMANMAHISQGPSEEDGHRSELIGSAKSIAARAKGIRKLALAAAENCSDKRLRADLLFLCDRLPTLATQLKIISSVRAAATHHSEDTDQMLISNAQNLMDSVQRTVRACEAASIKSFNVTVSVVNTAIKWKRKTRRSLRG
eukprot:m.56122 g.56122  ORF g.56122 m.56122 type:complete len:833 (+) comp11174_c0_seq1:156-2654(+)